MAQNLTDHLKLSLLVNGNKQVTPSSIRVKFESGAQEVTTLEGLAGKTPGSGKVTISCTCAVRTSGPEHDYFGAIVLGSYETMQVPFGPKSYRGEGWYNSVEIGQSVNQQTELSFEWQGKFSKPD